MTAQLWVAALAGAAGSTLSGLRWGRVAQREHYLAGSATRFAWRWWAGSPANRAMWVLASVAVLLSGFQPAVEVATALVVAAGPLGLGIRGRTSKLAWTPRLRRLALTWGALQALLLAGSVLLGVEAGGGAVLLGVVVLGVPAVMDAACRLTSPLERRLLRPFVASAASRLASVGPVVVGITGSYGKTSTKGCVAHLVSSSRSVLASPASYNNLAGLARALNEGLAPGTEVFVAEMGTYGPGEIAELCSWVTPSVSVITAIGPVHLERMGSEEAILAAKAEILVDGAVAVLNVDDPRLAGLARSESGRGRRVWRCSALDPAADVWVGAGSGVLVRGDWLCGPPPPGAPPTNVACAVAVALELGAPREEVARLVPSLPVLANRLSRREGEAGFAILDDTYNSNPAGAAMAIDALAGSGGPAAARVVVTPGMVELGERQEAENEALARRASGVVTQMVVVGRTNRRALLAGAGSSDVVLAQTREEAVAWVREHLGPGDAVLYENDLPDHYP
ncbi:MAG: Mur ligase family protein [Acidimicrobiales bacterium]